jgi:hypothetical protein
MSAVRVIHSMAASGSARMIALPLTVTVGVVAFESSASDGTPRILADVQGVVSELDLPTSAPRPPPHHRGAKPRR